MVESERKSGGKRARERARKSGGKSEKKWWKDCERKSCERASAQWRGSTAEAESSSYRKVHAGSPRFTAGMCRETHRWQRHKHRAPGRQPHPVVTGDKRGFGLPGLNLLWLRLQGDGARQTILSQDSPVRAARLAHRTEGLHFFNSPLFQKNHLIILQQALHLRKSFARHKARV